MLLSFAQEGSVPLPKKSQPIAAWVAVTPKLKWHDRFANSSIQQMRIIDYNCQILFYLPVKAAAIIRVEISSLLGEDR